MASVEENVLKTEQLEEKEKCANGIAKKSEENEDAQHEDDNGYYPEEEITQGQWNTRKVEVKQVQVITGEEEEDCLWKNRAKLYRWSPDPSIKGGGEWKERGIGDAKLLQHQHTKKIRFLLRQEKTLKVVANHYVVQRDVQCKLTPNVGSDKIWVWTVLDCAEDPPKTEQFALKFTQIDHAQLFKEKFEEAAKTNDSLGVGKPASSSTQASSAPKKEEKTEGAVEEEAGVGKEDATATTTSTITNTDTKTENDESTKTEDEKVVDEKKE